MKRYIVIVSGPVGDYTYEPYHKFFTTEKEARRYKDQILKQTDYALCVEIYEAKQI